MEINITEFKREGAFHYSRSIMEGGTSAGADTWNNAKRDAPQLLKTPEQRDAFNKYVRGFGAWAEEEIATWTDQEANALFVQFIASEIRQASADTLQEIDWEQYEEENQSGQNAGTLFKSESGDYFFSLYE